MLRDALAGRTLASLETRVDEIDAKVAALNSKVSEQCANFEEVKAYVDKHSRCG